MRVLPHNLQVFDGDIPYLYKQSRNNRLAFKSATGNDWVKEYFLPGQSDRCAPDVAKSCSCGYCRVSLSRR